MPSRILSVGWLVRLETRGHQNRQEPFQRAASELRALRNRDRVCPNSVYLLVCPAIR